MSQNVIEEAIVAGYVVAALRNGASEVPRDSAMVADALRIARANPDLYPILSKYDQGAPP
jgi:hypothetical protein